MCVCVCVCVVVVKKSFFPPPTLFLFHHFFFTAPAELSKVLFLLIFLLGTSTVYDGVGAEMFESWSTSRYTRQGHSAFSMRCVLRCIESKIIIIIIIIN